MPSKVELETSSSDAAKCSDNATNKSLLLSNIRIKFPQFDHLVSGMSAGLVSTVSLHPLDVVKTRFQVHEGAVGRNAQSSQSMYRSTFSALRYIIGNEGIPGAYRGIVPALFGSGMSWGLYFSIYERAKLRYHNWTALNSTSSKLPAQYHLASGVEAGTAVVLLTNPIWLIKTRLQLQTSSTLAAGAEPYTGFLNAGYRIIQEEGFFALYRGIFAALMLTSHGAIQFVVYEELKHVVHRWKNGDTPTVFRPWTASSDSPDPKPKLVNDTAKLGTIEWLGMGAASKMVASIVTYPPQVIKARLQQRQVADVKYTGTRQSLMLVINHEGFLGLYKGLGPTLLRVLPQSALTFTTYENVKKLVSQM